MNIGKSSNHDGTDGSQKNAAQPPLNCRIARTYGTISVGSKLTPQTILHVFIEWDRQRFSLVQTSGANVKYTNSDMPFATWRLDMINGAEITNIERES